MQSNNRTNMDEIKGIIDDVGIAAFEANLKIAALAVVSNNGILVYQTSKKYHLV